MQGMVTTKAHDYVNRLTQVESRSDAPAGSKRKLLFTCDIQGRRLSKTVSNWVSGDWQLQSTNRCLYDGWNLLEMLDSSSQLLASFTWGLDLSGSRQGAGGGGGLRWMNQYGANSLLLASSFYAYDGNGNVIALVEATDGTLSARYEYGPFGEPIRGKGVVAEANPFRFSTKFQDNETDFLYYGYRYYNPSTGRWLSRDPIGERGGLNLQEFVLNNPTCFIDKHGLYNPITGSDGRSVGPGSGLPSPMIFFPPGLPPSDNPSGGWLILESGRVAELDGQSRQSSHQYGRNRLVPV